MISPSLTVGSDTFSAEVCPEEGSTENLRGTLRPPGGAETPREGEWWSQFCSLATGWRCPEFTCLFWAHANCHRCAYQGSVILTVAWRVWPNGVDYTLLLFKELWK